MFRFALVHVCDWFSRVCVCVCGTKMTVAGMICNPSGSEGLRDLSPSGCGESTSKCLKGREANKISIACLLPSDIFSIVAAELHINVKLTHYPPPTEERRGGARINKHDFFLQ